MRGVQEGRNRVMEGEHDIACRKRPFKLSEQDIYSLRRRAYVCY